MLHLEILLLLALLIFSELFKLLLLLFPLLLDSLDSSVVVDGGFCSSEKLTEKLLCMSPLIDCILHLLLLLMDSCL